MLNLGHYLDMPMYPPIFSYIETVQPLKPILISVPHCGVEFPEEIRHKINSALLPPDDTDFFVHKLYDFATDLGITIIHSNYSRWVIDLNRDPESKPLYSDGRIITGLVPVTDFAGRSLYKGAVPDEKEIAKRLTEYYWPYHEEIRKKLKEMRTKFDHVLLFDAHSIRKSVPTININPFPDLILGDNDYQSASESVIKAALEVLNTGNHSVTHNTPFKGGFITRNFGNPENGVHGLQLEMAKINYMDDEEKEYDTGRADEMRKLLNKLFLKLIKSLEELNQSHAI